MAGEFSFDVVSEFDAQELRNALDQARREIATRFDFKGATAEITQEKDALAILADSELRAKSIRELVETKAVRRGLSLKIFDWGEIEQAGGMKVRQHVGLRSGLPDDLAKEGHQDPSRRVPQGQGPDPGRRRAGQREEQGRPPEGDRATARARRGRPAPVLQLPLERNACDRDIADRRPPHRRRPRRSRRARRVHRTGRELPDPPRRSCRGRDPGRRDPSRGRCRVHGGGIRRAERAPGRRPRDAGRGRREPRDRPARGPRGLAARDRPGRAGEALHAGSGGVPGGRPGGHGRRVLPLGPRGPRRCRAACGDRGSAQDGRRPAGRARSCCRCRRTCSTRRWPRHPPGRRPARCRDRPGRCRIRSMSAASCTCCSTRNAP